MNLRTIAGLKTAGMLGAIGGLHAAWAAGSTWPAADEATLGRAVVGVENAQMPGRAATLGVAGLLAAAACATVDATLNPDGGLIPRRLRTAGLATAATLLGVRGVVGLASADLFGYSAAEPFPRLNRLVYSPLCLGLAAGLAMVLRRP